MVPCASWRGNQSVHGRGLIGGSWKPALEAEGFDNVQVADPVRAPTPVMHYSFFFFSSFFFMSTICVSKLLVQGKDSRCSLERRLRDHHLELIYLTVLRPRSCSSVPGQPRIISARPFRMSSSSSGVSNLFPSWTASGHTLGDRWLSLCQHTAVSVHRFNSIFTDEAGHAIVVRF